MCIRDSWWTNILYINNFIPTDGGQCMGWGWYLSNDFQYYIVTPIFILLWVRSRTQASILWFFSLISSLIITAVLVDHYGINAYVLLPSDSNYYVIEYIKPYTRAAPYLIGMMVAFILQTWPHWDFSEKHVWLVRLGHLVSAGMLLASVFSLYPESSGDDVWNDSENAAYITLSRLGWALGLAWIVFVCAKGHGGVVNQILSLPVWQPLAALSYGAYLLHPMFMETFYWNIKVYAWHLDDLFYPVYFGAAVVFSLSSAAILHLLIEVPFAHLEGFFSEALKRPLRQPSYTPMLS
eukprot:TRINITY_DN1570_c0_g2_i3.p1 TRINITY_DN1570_c0_g2~~TRINITY_DN1570_c0_g2_i3.p1  ORF type:complete len:294 (-),score=29.46 TRINITY_DN1570_c0_g2_i3:558-1439(-)